MCHGNMLLLSSYLANGLAINVMSNRLGKLWKLMAGFDLIDIDNDYFMVKFDLEGDRVNVMEGGPWMNFDHYPTVQT